jgi:membrane fusion protein (multidrug efflux system)
VDKSKRSLLWLGVGVVVVGALVWVRLEPTAAGNQAPASAEQEALEVEVHRVTPHVLVERFSTVGTIEADEQVDVRSEISGVLAEIRFAEGARVAAGQVLVELDDTLLTAERDRALHRLELAQLREARQQDLLAQGLTSQDDYDLALSQLNVLAAELRLTEAQLAKTVIRAPFGGVIGLRQVSPGATVSPQTRIATLQKMDPVKIEFTVPEGHADKIKVGDTVQFRVRGSERQRQGRIYAFEPMVDRETRSLRARARCANDDGLLLPGAFADVELAVREIADALTVPSMAVIPELGSKKVFVVEDGKAAARLVETGVRTESEVQITSGLEPDDLVIVTAVQQLSTGRAVRQRVEGERAAP